MQRKKWNIVFIHDTKGGRSDRLHLQLLFLISSMQVYSASLCKYIVHAVCTLQNRTHTYVYTNIQSKEYAMYDKGIKN